ncbi:heterokaryon incompatibility protein-domain-containing protein [Microdochium trichocladiopsis]|uniref:Heterokaryon incompatibility protein-domain-containing protein n=1 Tax=Microdochium trichocladiopsis TaxID=1682393 RepID=A0A9P8XUB5_9PEZI|nr:heterokaryon incompatibility protein-domain-containing protein [Microdochium trichocladiopsis]KAH7018056.1 heterokaryon incompatibility protein-domain-containing protein [Microdochium trichocladiopsis]
MTRPRSLSASNTVRTPIRRRVHAIEHLLADDARSWPTVTEALSKISYKDGYSLVGADVGLAETIMVCAPCKSLLQTSPLAPLQSHQYREIRKERDIPIDAWHTHHRTLFALLDCCYGHRQTCCLCEVLWQGLRRQLSRQRSLIRMIDKQKEDLAGSALCLRNDGVVRIMFVGSSGLLTNLPFAKQLDADSLMLQFRWFTLHLQPNSNRRRDTLLTKSTASPEAFSQIRSWIALCDECHGHCQKHRSTNSGRPTRLILIDRTDVVSPVVRLVNSPPSPKYMALSYRWGATGSAGNISPTKNLDVTMLNAQTEATLRAGIPVSSLRRTIRDACTVASELNIHYLWVDRMCIIQDSREDWQREAGHMATVYKSATVTLAASCASNEDHGIFRNRRADRLQPLRLHALSSGAPPDSLIATYAKFRRSRPGSLSPGSSSSPGSYYVYSDLPHQNDRYRGKLGYLGDRGWVYQERLLSPRIVYFSEEQVYWECRESEINEIACLSSHYRHHLGRSRPWDLVSVGHDRQLQLQGDEKARWHRCVQHYGRLELTFPQDRLTALSGLAKEYFDTQRGYRRIQSGKGKPERYYAGLWEQTFLDDLCWYATTTPILLPEYVAPSWSWASVTAEFRWRGPRDSYLQPLARINSVHIKQAGHDPFGAIQDGWLSLRATVKPIKITLVGGVAVKICQRDSTPLGFCVEQNSSLDDERFARSLTCLPLFCLALGYYDHFYGRYRTHGPSDLENTRMHGVCLILAPQDLIRHQRPQPSVSDHNSPHDPSPDSPGLSQLDTSCEQYQRVGIGLFTFRHSNGWKPWLDEEEERDIIIR